MPRTKDEIWKHFDEVTLANGSTRAECQICKKSIASLVARMKLHHEDCKRKRAGPTTEGAAPVAKVPKQPTLPFLTGGSKQRDIELQVTRCIIATGSPFRTVENQQFKALVQMLRPGTTLPTRQKVSEQLLDEVYATEQTNVTKSVEGQNATILVDGWSDLTNHPVIGVAFVVNGQCYLINTLDTTGTPHTADNLVNIMRDQIQDCETRFKVIVTSLVCDNAANMVKMRNALKEEACIHVFGCGAHFTNLLAKDICNAKDSKTVLNKVLSIVKFLRNNHAALAKLNEKEMTKPPVPVETRWNSQHDMLVYFINNWMEIACIVSTLRPRNDPLYRYMEDIHLKRVSQDLVEVLSPVSQALDVIQNDSSVAGDSVKIWKKMLNECPGGYKEFVVQRMNEALSPPVLAANILDHRYQGRELTVQEMQKGLEYIKSSCPEASPHVMAFIAQEEPFCKSLFESTYASVSPIAWWKTGVRLGFPKELSGFAISLVGAAISSAGLERLFSTLGFTYGKLRAHLGAEKAGKIAFLYRQLNK